MSNMSAERVQCATKTRNKEDCKEIEIKFVLGEKAIENLVGKIEGNGGKFVSTKYEKTIMYDSDDRKMETIDARLRVRISGKDATHTEHVLISFKQRLEGRSDKGVDTQREIELKLDGNQFKAVEEIFKLMGYDKTTSYERFRTVYTLGASEIAIDKFPFGHIVEIESDSEEYIEKVMVALDLDINSSTTKSCDDVYHALCRKHNVPEKPDILFSDEEIPKL